jgi:hypothetical protein
MVITRQAHLRRIQPPSSEGTLHEPISAQLHVQRTLNNFMSGGVGEDVTLAATYDAYSHRY